VLYATDRGCTRPGCTAPPYRCQAHHLHGWTAHHGQTNIDNLTLACPPDNRLVEHGGWTTRKRHDGRTERLPPTHLDTGQARINDYHHPQHYLREPDDDDEPE
jgi:HNH endonuclease